VENSPLFLHLVNGLGDSVEINTPVALRPKEKYAITNYTGDLMSSRTVLDCTADKILWHLPAAEP